LKHLPLASTAIALAVVALAITAGVYGVVALIVKLDDIGLHLAERGSRSVRSFGNMMVQVVPKLLTSLSGIGTAAMLWVGGGIVLHGIEELHVAEAIPHALHDFGRAVGARAGSLGGLVEWLVGAIGGAIAGLIVGTPLVAVVRMFTKRPEELIVD
jgi:predicted DNA repair protein MutK